MHGVKKSQTWLSDWRGTTGEISVCTTYGLIMFILTWFSFFLIWFEMTWKSLSVWLCKTVDYTVHGILQVRILEWVAVPFSRGSFQPRDQSRIFHTAGDSLTVEPLTKPKNTGVGSLSLLQQIFLTQESNWDLLNRR